MSIGTIVSKRYVIRHVLAVGGMAEIYLASTKNGEQVVLKRLKDDLPELSKVYKLFINEALILLDLHHRNIVAGKEYFEENGSNFIVMEYLQGKSLVQLVTPQFSPQFRINLALSIGIEISLALSYINAFYKMRKGALHDFVHKDISLQNILVTQNGCAKIIDFGIAQTPLSEADDSEMLRGNIHYMSPEQKSGGKLGQTSDIYSLALLMVEIIRGEKWRDRGSDPLRLVDLNLLGAEFTFLLKKSLSFHADERIQSCEELANQLLGIEQERLLDRQKTLCQAVLATPKVQTSSTFEKAVRYFGRVCALSGAMMMIIFLFFCIGIDFFRQQLTIVGPELKKPVVIPAEERLSSSLSSTTRTWGTLSLLIYPWAEVFVNDEFLGSTPMKELKLPPGDYVIQLRHPSYSAIALRRVKIYADKRTELIHNF